MATYEDELLVAARRLLARRSAQRGRLPAARIRRSISTAYYALFHFLLSETGGRIIGTTNDLRRRRRLIARTISHKGMRTAMLKVRGRQIDPSVANFFASSETPLFVRNLAAVFVDAQDKRLDADYDLNEALSERDARLLLVRVTRALVTWRQATTVGDRDTKHALCLLILLKGQLRAET